jgi:hypothetical protein
MLRLAREVEFSRYSQYILPSQIVARYHSSMLDHTNDVVLKSNVVGFPQHCNAKICGVDERLTISITSIVNKK